MRPVYFAIASFITISCDSKAQTNTTYSCPTIAVTAKIPANTFKFGKDIPIVITLTNKTATTQDVSFDKPKLTTGGPHWTSVILTNKKTGLSVLQYQNKAILESQVYSNEQIKQNSYKLKPGQKLSRQFSLYDLVVLLDDKGKVAKGNYEMQIIYCDKASNKLNFTVE